jgi:2-polyprenyl-6-methoxyphenol hydroxylase-like FAD-dependent oxidoreductase
LYEKDEHADVRKQGYALTLQQGVRVMKWLGFDRDTDLVENGAISDLHRSFHKDGSSLGVYGPSPGPRQKSNHNVHIPRQVLRNLLFTRLDVEDVRWGHEVEDYLERSEASTLGQCGRHVVGVRFANGESVECGLLVGADGIFSRVRSLMHAKASRDSRLISLLTPPPSLPHDDDDGDALKYLDLMVVLGIAPEENCHVQKQWLDGRTRCFSMPYNASYRMWQLSFPSSEVAAISATGNQVALRALALKQCEGWPKDLTSLIAATGEHLLSGHPVYDRDPLVPGTAIGTGREDDGGFRSCVTLVGDSIHPMSPFKGQGANQALLSAYDLARSLSGTTLAPRRVSVIPPTEQRKSHKQRKSSKRGKNLDEDDDEMERVVDTPVVVFNITSVGAALDRYEQPMLVRAAEKMLKSREAAALLHSADALNKSDSNRAAAAAAAAAALAACAGAE